MSSPPGIQDVRAWFPALNGETILLENAGGSQVPACVAEALGNHMLSAYVQLGAGYPMSDKATKVVADAHTLVETILNGAGTGKAILGSSCTSLTTMLSGACMEGIEAGDEIVLCEQGHEANIGPWLRLEACGATIRWWRVDPDTGALNIKDLQAVISEKTRIVAFPHVSNLLGAIVDARAVARLAHAHGARVVVDGVALAPHRAVDVEALDADAYVYSTYKVFGPHMGALWVKNDFLDELTRPNHFFIPRDDVPYAFELGGPSHEGCAGINALAPYLGFLAGSEPPLSTTTAHAAFNVMRDLEAPVQAQLLERLTRHPDVRIIGPASADVSQRVATVSFLHTRVEPEAIVAAAHAAGVGIRNGHMYAHRLLCAMKIPVDAGVVRVSAVHYNTIEEIDHLMDALDPILGT